MSFTERKPRSARRWISLILGPAVIIGIWTMLSAYVFTPTPGSWTGTTSRAHPMSFTVSAGSGQWTTFKLTTDWSTGGTSGTTQVTINGPGDITGDQFSYSGATYAFTGTFTSDTAASGTYAFTNHQIIYGIPFPPYIAYYYLTQSGTWTASGPAPAATITVTSPNGAESWAGGSSQNITWTTTGTIANVKLEYSTDGGSIYTTIIASTANTGTYPWTIPNTPSTNCLVRASDASNASIFDTTNAAFTITGSGVAKDNLLGTWDGQGVYFRNSDTGAWTTLASAADLIASGDLGGDGIDDLFGIWSGQAGVWTRDSAAGAWTYLGSSARHIGSGDMNGDGRVDFLGTWDGQGVYYRDSIGGTWTLMATPAELITAGDLDGDTEADLIGIWAGQAGVWVKYSLSGTWSYLGSSARDMTTGDMNGDGRADLVGTWDGQGVYYKDSIGGGWTQIATPADQIAAGDLDGDGTDDLIGIWAGQAGIWVKYSQAGSWAFIGSSARDIGAGLFTGGAWSASSAILFELEAPMGGTIDGPPATPPKEIADATPGGRFFNYQVEGNLKPQVTGTPSSRIPGPGEPGFRYRQEKDILPGGKNRK